MLINIMEKVIGGPEPYIANTWERMNCLPLLVVVYECGGLA